MRKLVARLLKKGSKDASVQTEEEEYDDSFFHVNSLPPGSPARTPGKSPISPGFGGRLNNFERA